MDFFTASAISAFDSKSTLSMVLRPTTSRMADSAACVTLVSGERELKRKSFAP